MWLVVDRIEANTVILQDDGETLYTLSADDYIAMTGESPTESLVLDARMDGGSILALMPSPEETERRRVAARERLARLAARKRKW